MTKKQELTQVWVTVYELGTFCKPRIFADFVQTNEEALVWSTFKQTQHIISAFLRLLFLLIAYTAVIITKMLAAFTQTKHKMHISNYKMHKNISLNRKKSVDRLLYFTNQILQSSFSKQHSYQKKLPC